MHFWDFFSRLFRRLILSEMERSEENECLVSEEPKFTSGNHERTGSFGSDPPAGPGRRLRPPEQVNGRLVDSGRCRQTRSEANANHVNLRSALSCCHGYRNTSLQFGTYLIFLSASQTHTHTRARFPPCTASSGTVAVSFCPSNLPGRNLCQVPEPLQSSCSISPFCNHLFPTALIAR